MTKDEFTERLRAAGYQAENENGCVVVLSPDHKDFTAVGQMAESVGFDGSYGWRKRND